MKNLGEPHPLVNQGLGILETERKKVYKQLSIWSVIGIVLLVIIAGCIGNTEGNLQVGIGIAGVITGILYFRFFLQKPLEATRKFKDQLRALMIASISEKLDAGIRFFPDKYIPREDFLESKLFNKIPNAYTGGNYFLIKDPEFKVEFSYVHASVHNSTQEYQDKLFDGLLFVFTQPSTGNDRMLVVPDSSLGAFEFITDAMDLKKYAGFTRVKFNEEEFEELFNVFSNSTGFTQRMFDHELQNMLINLQKQYGSRIRLSIGNGKTYLLIETFKSYFNISIETEVNNETMQQAFFKDLAECLGLINLMKPYIRKI